MLLPPPLLLLLLLLLLLRELLQVCAYVYVHSNQAVQYSCCK